MFEWLKSLVGSSGERAPARKKRDPLGDRGENVAARHLQRLGYKIIARNYRTPVGEIDIIARRGRVVAYVEVKHRPDAATALGAVSDTARRRIIRAAEWYGARLRDPDLVQRFDVVAVRPWRLPLHMENAWTA